MRAVAHSRRREADDRTRTVLMITYVFPPSAWVGVHRTLKYCRYLGRHGWRPIVLTARPAGVTFKDQSLLSQLPENVEVHRTFDIDPAKWEEKLTDRKLRRMQKRDDASSTPVAVTQPARVQQSRWTKLKRTIKVLLKNSPDSHLFWVPFAFARGLWVLLTRRVDVIYSTTPPHSSHIATYLLAKCFRKPYVLDFRDPWYVLGSVRSPSEKIERLLRLETRVKRQIVRNATRIICVSRGERDEMRHEYPEVDSARFHFITNGYDPLDAVPQSPPRQDRRLVVTHAGTIYPDVAGAFFDALEQAMRAEPDLAAQLEVRLLGDIAFEYQGVIRRLGELGILSTYGMVAHAKTLQIMGESDVLLILMGGGKYTPSHLPSKAFEYLHAEKPILAIAEDGELAELVRRSGLGTVVAPDSTDQILSAVVRLCEARALGLIKVSPDRSFIRTFERPALAAQLASVFDEIACGSSARGSKA